MVPCKATTVDRRAADARCSTTTQAAAGWLCSIGMDLQCAPRSHSPSRMALARDERTGNTELMQKYAQLEQDTCLGWTSPFCDSAQVPNHHRTP